MKHMVSVITGVPSPPPGIVSNSGAHFGFWRGLVPSCLFWEMLPTVTEWSSGLDIRTSVNLQGHSWWPHLASRSHHIRGFLPLENFKEEYRSTALREFSLLYYLTLRSLLLFHLTSPTPCINSRLAPESTIGWARGLLRRTFVIQISHCHNVPKIGLDLQLAL